MKTILFLIATVWAGIAMAADNPFINVHFTHIGFQTPDALIVICVADGKVNWPKGPPPLEKRELWDQVVLNKDALATKSAVSTSEAITEWNKMVMSLEKTGMLEGKDEENAIAIWKTIKTLFPHLCK